MELEQTRDKVDDVLGKLLQPPTDDFLHPFYEMIRSYTLSGGKALRAHAVVLGYGRMDKKICLPAAAIELHHTYSLILDDVMDEDSLRRQKPTVFVRLQKYYDTYFKEVSYDGLLFSKQSSRFAVSFAIMLGNITNILSKKAMFASNFSQDLVLRALQLTETYDEQLYHGQMQDVHMEMSESATEEEYMRMIALKTGTLFGLSFRIGALFAGEDEHTQHLFGEFGRTTAMAFQIQDDILDLTGKKGHEVGSDIRRGKKTLLLLKTMKKSKNPLLASIVGQADAPDSAVRDVIRIMHETGAVRQTREIADRLNREAKTYVEQMDISSAHKELLYAYADSMVERKR